MHFITTLKSSGEIIDYRVDDSVPQYWTTDTLKSAVSSSRSIAEDTLETYSFAKLPAIADGVSINALTPHIHAYDTTTNELKNNASYIAPAVEKRFSLNDIVSKLSLAEKSKFINRSTPAVVTAVSEMQTLKNEADTIEILQFLVDSGDISQASMNKILA
jgi:hypothetical protein